MAPVAGPRPPCGQAAAMRDDHPFQFALAMLVSLLCALLLVRELRRG